MATSKEAATTTAHPHTAEVPRTCFVVAPIGGDGTDIRRRSDQVLRYIIDPVLSKLNFAPAVRADKMTAGGLITRQVIDQILTADLVVADLTGHNPNVFYELALRHAFRKPFVQLAVGKTRERLPFDVQEQRTIFFDHTDLDDVELAKATFEDYVSSAMEPGADIESPVSQTVDLMSLRSSDDPEQRGQADIIEMLEDLRQVVTRNERTSEPSSPSADVIALRFLVEQLASRGELRRSQHLLLTNADTSTGHDRWVRSLLDLFPYGSLRSPSRDDEPDAVTIQQAAALRRKRQRAQEQARSEALARKEKTEER